MERITHKEINKMVEHINETMNEDKEHFELWADYASVYGGWRLNRVEKSSGGHYGWRSLSSTMERMSTKEFYCFLKGIEIGGEK